MGRQLVAVIAVGAVAVAAAVFALAPDSADRAPDLVWGKRGVRPGELARPRAAAIDTKDRLLLVDFTARVQAFDLDGNHLGPTWTTPDFRNGRPSGLGVTHDGNLIVCDSHYHCLRIYSHDGTELKKIGGEAGKKPGQWGYVSDCVQDADGFFYVSEFGENDRITKLDADGKFVACWGEPGQKPGQFNRVRALALSPDGFLYAADACNHRVQVFTKDGQLVRAFGEPGTEPGQFQYPYDLAFNADGELYVVEYGNCRVQKFDQDGKPAGDVGGAGQGAGPPRLAVGAGRGPPRPGARNRHREPPGSAGSLLVPEFQVPPFQTDTEPRNDLLELWNSGTLELWKKAMRDFLATHWLGLAFVVVAAGLTALAVARRSRWSAAGAYLCGFLGLGGLLLSGLSIEVAEEKLSVAQSVLVLAAGGFVVALVVLAFARVWSFWIGTALGALLLLGVGGLTVRPLAAWLAEAGRSLRGLEFVRPEWLVLLAFVPLVFLVSRRSLSGLGPSRKWVAISARALLIALLALALAEPRLRRQSEHVTVLFVVDRSFSVPQDLDPDKPATEAVDRRWEKVRGFIEQAVDKRYSQSRNDQFGVILFGKRPRLALPPAPVFRTPVDERMAGPIDGNYTDIAAAIKLALASFPEGTGKRIVLVSDGNENLGSSEEQAALARQNGVQIDAIALAPGFKNESEVLVEAVVAPPVTALGERFLVRVLVRNATPDRIVDGRLDVVKATAGVARPLEIEDGPQVLEPGTSPKVRLPARELSVFKFHDQVDPRGDSAFAYRATFTPTESRPLRGGSAVAGGLPGDRTANNRASAAVVSRGLRRVLFLDEAKTLDASPHAHLIRVLRTRSNIDVRWRSAEQLPGDKSELGVFLSNYDCIILANVPAERFTNDQMEMIRASVYDQGCGLIMIGGPDSFGAGGYQTTPIEAALPVDCEIKALKAAGKGGLVLVMHASEMADGNKWQKEIAKLAITRLGPEDMVGVTQYGFGGGQGVNWHIPFQRVGEVDSENRKKLLARVDSMMPGDMPDFDPFLRAACDTLKDERYGLSVKHTIVISDGDPNYSGPGQKAIDEMAEKGITCTTVGVATHGVNEDAKMKKIAEGTKDGSGKTGTFYKVSNPNQLPGIYIKESRRVSQSFIHKDPFTPTVVGGAGTSDVLAPGLPDPLPRLQGFVRTTKKENVLASMSLEGPTPYPDQRFPLLASWRYGLGKAVAFTSDARTVPGVTELGWDKDWASSDMYQKFWEQLVNWAMREAERGKLDIRPEYRDGRVRVVATVQDEKGVPISGLSLRGAVTPPGTPAPGEKPPTVEFKPKGGGVYEAEFAAEEAGSYFVNVQAMEPERGPDVRIVLNPDGTPKMKTFDAARAGVTVPYSPEFADLESNTPLMRRLAELTDGKFHTEADEELQLLLRSGDLFREAPVTTRSLLPFWFWLVFAAGVLLLFDVGVRRIAVEWAEARRWGANLWAGLRRQPIVVEESAALGQLLRRKAAVGEAIDRGRATRKFDPTQAPASEPAPAGADEYVSRIPTGGPTPAAPVGDRTEAPKEEEDELSRLRKAKLRAKHQQQKRDDEDDRR